MDLQNHKQTATPRKEKKQTFTEAVFFCFVFNLSKALRCLPPVPLCSGQLQAMPPFGSQAVSWVWLTNGRELGCRDSRLSLTSLEESWGGEGCLFNHP